MTTAAAATVNRRDERLAEFHDLAEHVGPADGCQGCADAIRRQRQVDAVLRARQCQSRQQVETILGKAVTS